MNVAIDTTPGRRDAMFSERVGDAILAMPCIAIGPVSIVRMRKWRGRPGVLIDMWEDRVPSGYMVRRPEGWEFRL